MRFAIQQSRTLVEECFSHTLCLHVGYLDVLSPTEFLQVDVSLLTKLGAPQCNQGLNASATFHSNCSIFLYER